MSETPVVTLDCCCCGGRARGRQWWNRDTGYGVCVECGNEVAKEEGEARAENLYGKRGVHWDVKEEACYP